MRRCSGQGEEGGVKQVRFRFGTLDCEPGVVAAFHHHCIDDHGRSIDLNGGVVVGKPVCHGEGLSVGIGEHVRQPNGLRVGNERLDSCRGKRHSVGFQFKLRGLAGRHVELEIAGDRAEKHAVAVFLHADSDGVLSHNCGGARQQSCDGIDGQHRICRHGVVPAEPSEVGHVDVRRGGWWVGHRIGCVASLFGRAKRIHQLVAVGIQCCMVPHKGQIGAHGHRRQFLERRAAVGFSGDVRARNVNLKGHARVLGASKIVEVDDGRVAATPLVHKVPSVRVAGELDNGLVDRLVDAEIGWWGATGVPHFHGHLRHIVGLKRNGEDVVWSNDSFPVPQANRHHVVEVGTVGVGRTAIAVHRQGDFIVVSAEVDVAEVAAHEVRRHGPRCPKDEGKKAHRDLGKKESGGGEIHDTGRRWGRRVDNKHT